MKRKRSKEPKEEAAPPPSQGRKAASCTECDPTDTEHAYPKASAEIKADLQLPGALSLAGALNSAEIRNVGLIIGSHGTSRDDFLSAENRLVAGGAKPILDVIRLGQSWERMFLELLPTDRALNAQRLLRGEF